MTLPADIRINVGVLFPPLVLGGGFVAVTKANGVWTIEPSYTSLVQIQSFQPNQKLVAVYDTVSGQYNTITLATLATLLPTFTQRVQRSITSTGNLPIVASDSILNVNAASDLIPIVPLASGRIGAPLTFKNLPGSHAQTITRTGSDTFDGVTTLSLAGGGSLTLVPYNDGVNAGWAIE